MSDKATAIVIDDEGQIRKLLRVVLEESGYHVRPVELVGVHQVLIPSEGRTTIAFLFRCELVDEIQHPITAPEIVETLWLTQEEIMARQSEHRSHTTTERFKSYFSGARYPMNVLTQLTKTVDHPQPRSVYSNRRMSPK